MVGDDYRIQLNNATPHTTNPAVQFAQVQGVDLLFKSADSPDVQPIKNIWGLIKCCISRDLGDLDVRPWPKEK